VVSFPGTRRFRFSQRADGIKINRQFGSSSRLILQAKPCPLLEPNVVKAMKKAATRAKKSAFNVDTFLATASGGRTIAKYRKGQKVFQQSDPADAVFYIQEGEVKVCVYPNRARKPWSRCIGREIFSARAA
jgi:hypothetical protein